MSRSIHKKRAISLILTLLLILTSVPAFGLVSSAGAGDQSVTVAAAGSAGKCAIIMTLSGAGSAGDGAATYLADRALYSDLSGMGSVYSVQFGMDAMKVSAYIECEGGGISNPFSATDVIRSISDNVKYTQTETGALTGAVPAVGETKTMTISARMNVVYKIGDYPIFEDACSVSAAVTVIGVDTTELRRAVRAANALREACWTADSWAALAAALSNANAILNGGNTLQNGIDAATAALDDALAALVHVNGSPVECEYCLGGSAGETLAPEELLNIQYGADATRQSLDLYLPAGVSGDAPLVLFIHGGAWIFGDKDGFRSECYNGCVKYGIPYAAINYRYASIGGVDAFDIMDDIDAALAKIKEVAAARGLNIVKFMPYGVSAGSHLSLLYAYTRHDTAPITPACVFDRCGPTTLYNYTYMTQSDDHEYFEYVLSAICGQVFTKDTMAIAYEALYAASPTSYVTNATVPTAICHGQQDNTVPFTDSEYLASLLQNKGVPYDFIIFPNSGHGLNSDPEQAAQADALYEQYVRIYLLDTMPAPAHNFTSVETPKTCTEAGYTTYTCTDCGAYFVGDVIGAGHTEADAVEENYIAATCKDEGGYDEVVYCSVCGQELSRTHHTIAILTTHTPADAVEENYNAGTCKTAGSYDEVVRCSVCGAELSRRTVETGVDPENHVHTSSVARTESTCTVPGYTAGVYCSDCGQYLSGHEELPLAEHTWNGGSVTTLPTCTADGVKTFTCSECGATKTEPVDALGHAFSDEWTVDTAASCETDGAESRHCSRCTATTDERAIPASGHVWNDGVITTAVTTTAEGVKTFTCTVCGDTKTEAVPKALANIAVTAENVSTGIKLTWAQDENATGYYVYRKTASTSYKAIRKVSSNATVTYTDTSAEPGTKYTYCVKSYRGTERGTYTAKSITCLAAITPTLANGKTGMTLTWTKAEGADGYYVFRKTGTGSYTTLKKIADPDTLTYTDTTAVSGTKYTYGVRAYKSTTKGAYTAKSMTCLSAVTPTLENTASGITVGWTKVTGATGYYVYRKEGSGSYSLVKKITSGATVSYSDTAVKDSNGTKYTYYVRAYKSTTLSAYTAKATYRVTGVAISSVTNSAAKTMTVKWAKNEKATGYEIQYATNSGFTSAKTVTVSGASTVSKAIASLTKGNTYYVRVRAYKTVSSVKYYSAWSAAKSVKITK